ERGVVEGTLGGRRTSVRAGTSGGRKTATEPQPVAGHASGRRSVSFTRPADGPRSVDHTCQVVPMKVGVAKETAPGERRVALVPEALGKLKAAGLEILVETGAGLGSSFPDSAYEEAGATIVATDALYQGADVILKVAKPSDAEVGKLRSGQAVVGFLAP